MRSVDLNNNIHFDDRFIFYKDNDLIIHKDNECINIHKNDHVINSFACPKNHIDYDISVIDDYIIIVFIKSIVIFNAKNNTIKTDSFYGDRITPIIPFSDNVLFGTVHDRRSQIVVYNLLECKKVIQSPSWLYEINDIHYDKGLLYVLLSNSIISVWNITEYIEVYKRTEKNKVNNIHLFNNGFAYVVGNTLRKIRDFNEVDNFAVPHMRTLHYINNDYVIYSDNNKVYKYHMKNQIISCEIRVVNVIDMIVKNGRISNSILLTRSKGGLCIIDLTMKKVVESIDGEFSKFKCFNNNVILNSKNKTVLYYGE